MEGKVQRQEKDKNEQGKASQSKVKEKKRCKGRGTSNKFCKYRKLRGKKSKNNVYASDKRLNTTSDYLAKHEGLTAKSLQTD